MKIKLNNVRLSFPSLFKASSFTGADGTSSDPKFSATFLLDEKENKADIARMEEGIAAMVKENFKGNAKALKGVCLRDGEEKTNDDGSIKDGFEGCKFVSASNKNRPKVVDRDPKIPLVAEDMKPYAGCYVNAVITLWAQNNKFGKRINANLNAVQFLRDGEPFGDANVNPEDEFDTIEDDGDSMLD